MGMETLKFHLRFYEDEDMLVSIVSKQAAEELAQMILRHLDAELIIRSTKDDPYAWVGGEFESIIISKAGRIGAMKQIFASGHGHTEDEAYCAVVSNWLSASDLGDSLQEILLKLHVMAV